MVSDSSSFTKENRQRNQELLEHPPQETANPNGNRPGDPQAEEQPGRLSSVIQTRSRPQPHGSMGNSATRSRSQAHSLVQTPLQPPPPPESHRPTPAAATTAAVGGASLFRRAQSVASHHRSQLLLRLAREPRVTDFYPKLLQ